MRCNDAQHLIHLHRPGERTEEEERLLEMHFRTCATCAREAERVGQTIPDMDMVIRSAVPPVHVGQETRAIMERIAADAGGSPDLFGILLGIGRRRSVQFAYGVLTLFAIVTMGTQIAGLRHTADAPGPTARPYISYTIDTQPLAQLAALPVPESIKASVLSRPTLEIRKEDLDRSVRLAGQAALHSMSFTREQRRLAEMVITSLGRSSELTIRLGKIGG